MTYKKGQVPVFDFSGKPEPTGKLQVTQLIQGNGPKVKSGQTLIVHYVGQVFGAKEPFDSSYSRNDAATFPIGVGQVVQGWDKSLVGQKVGSRVIVQIPPELGYGENGNEGAGIKGTDTIVFAVDILGAV
ncbi:FKBP-type peptidyl-prolyl cis-trans isomerase [Nocardioides daphniae]|uniref:Peptidyl-prolyl cis-trans isomerase n=1 Tax=Nocardioides daphniae TaxID=402297 RepID=A0A4P7UFN6_9ACTN|nr:FKBP-type peptidyl-prolyl cis-trans isomerase [Nocardioides daphniae]